MGTQFGCESNIACQSCKDEKLDVEPDAHTMDLTECAPMFEFEYAEKVSQWARPTLTSATLADFERQCSRKTSEFNSSGFQAIVELAKTNEDDSKIGLSEAVSTHWESLSDDGSDSTSSSFSRVVDVSRSAKAGTANNKRRKASLKSVSNQSSVRDGGLNTSDGASSQTAHACAKAKHLTILNPGDMMREYDFKRLTLAGRCSKTGSIQNVQRATHKVTKAVRAIKSIPKDVSKDAVANLKERIAVMTMLDHPNLIRLHELFEDADCKHLVMDCCSGGCLQDYVNKHGYLSEVKTAVVMQQVFRAVRYLHRRTLCHRDIRPQNVLLHSRKDLGFLKLSGYGAACFCNKSRKLTKTVGLSGRQAPEMIAGSYGKECDIWSCGVTMFELLCHRLPFEGDDSTKNIFTPKPTPSASKSPRKSITTSPRRLPKKQLSVMFTQQDENVSRSARELLSMLLQADPCARYSAIQALHHKWINKAVPKLNSVLEPEAIVNLKNFRKMNILKQASMRMIASMLSEADHAPSRKLFLSLDLDGDGLLTLAEIQKRISEDPKLAAAYPDVTDIMRHHGLADAKSKNTFSYTEFIAATFNWKQCVTEEICRVVFRCYDKDGDGIISLFELAEGHLLGDLSLEELGTNMAGVDDNKDSCIDLEEFTRMLMEAS